MSRLQHRKPFTADATRENSEHKDLSNISYFYKNEYAKAKIKEISQLLDDDIDMQ